jgi:hypothetical protein
MFNSKGITPPCFPRKPDKALDAKVKNLGQVGIDAIQSVNISIKSNNKDEYNQALNEARAYLGRELGGSHYA